MNFLREKLNKTVKLAVMSALFYQMMSTQAFAADPLSLQQAVEKAVLTNPQVLQSYRDFASVLREKDAAFGRYLPSIDLSASYGAERKTDPISFQNGVNFTREQASLSLRQMLFDGFATPNEIKRLDKTSQAKLYELEYTSQTTALDTTKAFVDLIRYRNLVNLAEDNYVAHKIIYEQLLLKAKSGVGKKSDVEQAQSRLSLADYNMTVEGSNLHDIESRYENFVGNLPPKEINESLPINKDIPKDPQEAVKLAQLHNPLLLGTIQDISAQKAVLDTKNASFMPKVDFRARSDRGNDLAGYDGRHKDDVAEVVMTWNLFNGLTDYNLRKREQERLEVATNRRDKTCRDVRLELDVAYNDIKKLTDQVNYLDARQISIEKARDAYRKQFEIGQRTLVDLLNSENEVFEAKRLYINTVNDLAIAYARSHYQMGSLLNVLGVSRFGAAEAPLPIESSLDGASIASCPAEVASVYKVNREYLDARAKEAISTPK
jgi:adhesin transport system outer membrane protein